MLLELTMESSMETRLRKIRFLEILTCQPSQGAFTVLLYHDDIKRFKRDEGAT
jgi:hypothetical protein